MNEKAEVQTLDFIDEEIEKLKEKLTKLELSSKEYNNVVKSIEGLTKIKSTILDSENKNKIDREKLDFQKKEETIKLVIDAGKSLLIFGGTCMTTLLVLEFEKNGVIKSKVWSWLPKVIMNKL